MPFDQLTTFDFEDHAVRVVMIDGEPWFVAADVCRVLGIANPRDAVSGFDDDEVRKINLNTVGLTDGIRGNPNANVISEAGVYVLNLRCREAMTPGTLPHRFRKWVTSEVLPALRRTGRYEMPGYVPQPDPMAFMEDASLREREFWLSAVRETRLVAGPAAARRIWAKSPLPPLQEGSGPTDEAQGDEITAFLDECCEATGDPADFIRSQDLVDALQRWQDRRRLPRMGVHVAARRLSALAGRWRDKRTGETFRRHKRSIAGYVGLRLIEAAS